MTSIDKMKGTIRKLDRKKGNAYRARIDLPADQNERNVQTELFQSWKYDNPKQRARDWLMKWNVRLNEGDFAAAEAVTFDQYASTWLDRKQQTVRESTWNKYDRQLSLHILPRFGDRLLRKINPFELERFYAAKLDEGLSSTSVHDYHQRIRQIFDDAIRKNMIESNPARKVDAPQERTIEMGVLTAEQIDRFLESCQVTPVGRGHVKQTPIRYFPLYHTALATGMRLGELLGLRWEDVDFERETIHVRVQLTAPQNGKQLAPLKTEASRRNLPMTDENFQILKSRRQHYLEEKMAAESWEGKPVVFANQNGGFPCRSHVYKQFKKTLHRAGSVQSLVAGSTT